MSTPLHGTRWPLIVLLWIVGLFAAAQFGKLSLTLSQLAEVYPGAGLAVPLLVSVVGVVGILFGPVSGGLVARIGIRRAMLGAMLLGAAMSALQALVLPLPLFMVSRVIEGASHLTIVVAAPTLMAELATGRDRPVVMGLWGTFFGVSFALVAAVVPG